MASRSRFRLVLAVLIGLWIALTALPQSWKQWAPSFLKNPALHLGLDLVGGTQLDFRISEEEITQQLKTIDAQIATMQATNQSGDALTALTNERQAISDQKTNLVEAIRTVLERRINSLGVSEATITPSFVGNERHLLVECPGVIDTQECIKVVGKTIQLEFKEEFQEATAEFTKGVRATAAATLTRIQKGEKLESVGQDMSTDLGVTYRDNFITFKDELPKGMEDVWNLKPGVVVRREAVTKGTTQNSDGTTKEVEIPGVFLVEVLAPLTSTGRVINEAPTAFAFLSKTEKGLTPAVHEDAPLDSKVNTRIATALRGMQGGTLQSVTLEDNTARVLFLRQLIQGGQEVEVSHILVSYVGAAAAPAGTTRTKEQALARIKELKKQLDAGANFTTVALQSSDGPSAKQGGKLGAITHGTMPPSFEDIAFRQTVGKVSDPIETQFGYHLVRTDKAPVQKPDIATYDELTVTGTGASKRAENLVVKLKAGQVRTTEQALRLRTLFFSLQPSGWKDTELTGKHFRTAAVSLDPVTNIPVVQITFDNEGAKLFQELTKANIGKRIAIFVGGQLVSAPTVQAEISGGTAVITGSSSIEEARTLAQDLNTGAIPAPIYLVGQYTIEATLGAVALNTSLFAALIGTIILMLYMVFVYRGLGVIADVALFAYAVLFFALLKLPLLLVTKNYVVLTLAGMAGIILSIGMAVDANVLVFERMKEELRRGKSFRTALETSFKYAWPAIRDSNISTIITCLILFVIGTSIVRGFAVTLGLGVILSLFTAIVVTRWLLRKVAGMPIAERTELFVKPKRDNTINPL